MLETKIIIKRQQINIEQETINYNIFKKYHENKNDLIQNSINLIAEVDKRTIIHQVNHESNFSLDKSMNLGSSINLDLSYFYGIDIKTKCNKLTDLAANVSEKITNLSKEKGDYTFEKEISSLFFDSPKNENYVFQMIELYRSTPNDINLWRDLIFAHFNYNSN